MCRHRPESRENRFLMQNSKSAVRSEVLRGGARRASSWRGVALLEAAGARRGALSRECEPCRAGRCCHEWTLTELGPCCLLPTHGYATGALGETAAHSVYGYCCCSLSWVCARPCARPLVDCIVHCRLCRARAAECTPMCHKRRKTHPMIIQGERDGRMLTGFLDLSRIYSQIFRELE